MMMTLIFAALLQATEEIGSLNECTCVKTPHTQHNTRIKYTHTFVVLLLFDNPTTCSCFQKQQDSQDFQCLE